MNDDSEREPTYEEKVEMLDEILERLDNSETPIDQLAEDVKKGARLIKELESKLHSVETEVKDAFQELDKANGDEGKEERSEDDVGF